MDATQTTELEVYVDTSGFVDTSGSMSSSNRSIVSRDESEIEEGEYAADIFTYLKRREVSSLLFLVISGTRCATVSFYFCFSAYFAPATISNQYAVWPPKAA